MSGLPNEVTSLIASIVQDEGDRAVRKLGSEFDEQLLDGFSSDVTVIGDHHQLVADGIECPEHIEPFSSGRGLYEKPHERP